MSNSKNYVYIEHDKIQPFLERYGLKVKEVKHNIWEILNPDHAVNVDEIQYEIGTSIAFKKPKPERCKRDDVGYLIEYSKLYYIAVLPYDGGGESIFCWEELEKRGLSGHGKSVCSVYDPYGMRDENGNLIEPMLYIL